MLWRLISRYAMDARGLLVLEIRSVFAELAKRGDSERPTTGTPRNPGETVTRSYSR
jgi:hypothetical protein